MSFHRLTARAAVTALAAGLGFSSMPACAQAAEAAPPMAAAPSGVLNLTATATIELPNDWMSLVFSTTREGSDAATVQNQLKQAVDAALAESRKAARPGQIEVQTGAFSLYPRYGQKGNVAGWQGTAELRIEGRDMAGIAQLAGRISTLTIGRVGYGLSREAREKVEADVSAQAIARFRERAADYARQFGYATATVREVSVSAENPPQSVVPMMARAKTFNQAPEADLPIEAGKGSVTATVSGTIQMK